MIVEVGKAMELTNQGWMIFSPTAVCDRIGVKDGRVYFLEFKKKRSKFDGGSGNREETGC